MRIKYIYGVILFLTFSINANVTKWGATGHRVVGEIANEHLTKKAKREIKKLLKGQSLAFVSTYADEIKSDTRYSEFYSWHYINMDLDENYEDSEKNPKGDNLRYQYSYEYFGTLRTQLQKGGIRLAKVLNDLF